MRRVATGWESELTIAVDATIDAAGLSPLIAAFDRDNGGTRLRLTSEVLGGTWDALATRRADLAVGAPGLPPPGGGWTLRPFGTLEFVFTVASGHPLAAVAEPLTAQVLAPHRVIVLADTSRELLARSAGLTDRANTLTVADMPSKLAAIVAGLGVGHLPRPLAEQQVAAGLIRIKRLTEPMPVVEQHLAWRTDHEGKALAWFVSRLTTPQWRRNILGSGAAGKTAGIRRGVRK